MKRCPFILLLAAWSVLVAQSARASITLDRATAHVELSTADHTAKVIFTVEAGVELKWLSVFAPDGRRVLRTASNDQAELGIEDVTIESGTVSLEELTQTYPEGVYRFRGRTVNGEKVYGRATLGYLLPGTPDIAFPIDNSNDVSVDGFVTSWGAVPGATGYSLEVEQEQLNIALQINLLSSSTSFTVPPGWLLPNTDYTLSVTSIGANGNCTDKEIHFHTGS